MRSRFRFLLRYIYKTIKIEIGGVKRTEVERSQATFNVSVHHEESTRSRRVSADRNFEAYRAVTSRIPISVSVIFV